MYLIISIHLIDKYLILHLSGCLLWNQQCVIIVLSDNNLSTTTTLQQMFGIRKTCNNAYCSCCWVYDTTRLDNGSLMIIGWTICKQQTYTWELLNGITQTITCTAQFQHVSLSHREVNFYCRSVANGCYWLCRRGTYQGSLFERKTTDVTRSRTLYITEAKVILSSW